MEVGIVLAVVAVALILMAGREAVGRRVLAAVIAVAAVLATILGGVDWVVLGTAVVAMALSLWTHGMARTVWGGWLGLIALVTILAFAAQGAAPEAAFLFVWMALLVSLAAAAAALIGARLERVRALIPAALATVLGGAWLVSLSHPVFLGIGMDLPVVLVLMGLLILLLVRPLAPRDRDRTLAAAAAACLILACGVSLSARVAEPAPPADAGGPS